MTSPSSPSVNTICNFNSVILLVDFKSVFLGPSQNVTATLTCGFSFAVLGFFFPFGVFSAEIFAHMKQIDSSILPKYYPQITLIRRPLQVFYETIDDQNNH